MNNENTDLTSDIDKCCDLILGLMDSNNISKSAGINAMATIIVNVLSVYEDPKIFYHVIKVMIKSFEETKKEPR